VLSGRLHRQPACSARAGTRRPMTRTVLALSHGGRFYFSRGSTTKQSQSHSIRIEYSPWWQSLVSSMVQPRPA
jgi:hypothetical protein